MRLMYFLFIFVLFCIIDYNLTYSRVEKRIEIEEKKEQERIRKVKQKEARIREENKKKETEQIYKREIYSRTYNNARSNKYDQYANNMIHNKVSSLYKDIYKIIRDLKANGKRSELLFKYQLSGLDYICIDGKMQVSDNISNRDTIESVNKKISIYGYIRYHSREEKGYHKILTLILFLKEWYYEKNKGNNC